jgi:isoquinoline 1-oxidoreductase subunit alpha
MTSIALVVNGVARTIDVADPQTPLLWALRESLGLTGTKYGCGAGLCGACTVLVDGAAARSCQLPLQAVARRSITTIEGLSAGTIDPVQQAWIAEQVPQCGYCQSGQIMAAVALLASNPDPSDDEINAAMDGNLCRCGTYARIRRAIHRAAQSSRRAAKPVPR